MELSPPLSTGAFSPRPALTSLADSECCSHSRLVASAVLLTAVETAELRQWLGQPASPRLEHVLEHLRNLTAPQGIAQQWLAAGEGRRQLDADLDALYDHVFGAVAEGGPGSAVWQQVVQSLGRTAFVRVPSAGGGSADGMQFVRPRQLCFDLISPAGASFPVPTVSKRLMRSDPGRHRELMLALGATDAQLGAPVPQRQPVPQESRIAARCLATLLATLPAQFNDSLWSDFKVVVEGEPIFVHRLVVAPHSKPLAAMWQGAHTKRCTPS